MDELTEYLQQPVSAVWSVVAAFAVSMLTLACIAYWARRSDRKERARHDEWVRQFKAGETQ